MRIKISPAILLTVLTLSALCHGQVWSGILDPTRAIDWSNVGIPGGIPSGAWSQSGSTIQAATYGNGASDATAGIQAALNACGTNHYVLLGAGTFLINTTVSVPSNCALRGAGANQTILSVHGSSLAPITLGSGGVGFSGPSITSGAVAGSASIIVSSASGISTGTLLVISDLNDSWVTIEGGEGTCTWCDGWSTKGTRSRGQIVEVTSVAGTTIGIDPPLYTAYPSSPVATPFTASRTHAGVENLQVYQNATLYSAAFYMQECKYCWISGVEANYTPGNSSTAGNFVNVEWGYRDVIRDSYFSGAYFRGAGSFDTDIFLAFKTSASLIENNIIERGHASIMLNWGAAGNVIAYNYTMGEFDSSNYNFTIGGISMHGAHPQFNLLEGNVTTMYYADQVWGSSSHNTAFRNWTWGTTIGCTPASVRGTVNCTGANGRTAYQVSVGMQIARLSWYDNFVGNVVGSALQQSVLTTHNAITAYPSTRDGYGSTTFNYSFGYGESNDTGSGTGCSGGTAPCHSTDAYQTSLLYNDYSVSNSTVNCLSGGNASSCPTTLPASFYLSGTPTWWPSGVSFPAIGPDVTGGTGPGGHSSLAASNAAQNCYINTMGGSVGGAGSPLTFNASNCYGNAQPVSPPTGLQAVPH